MENKEYILKYGIWLEGDETSRDRCADIYGETEAEVWKRMGKMLAILIDEFGYTLWHASIWYDGKKIKVIK